MKRYQPGITVVNYALSVNWVKANTPMAEGKNYDHLKALYNENSPILGDMVLDFFPHPVYENIFLNGFVVPTR